MRKDWEADRAQIQRVCDGISEEEKNYQCYLGY